MLCFFFYSFRLCFLWELTSTVLQLWRWAGLYLGKYNVQFYVSLSGYSMKMGYGSQIISYHGLVAGSTSYFVYWGNELFLFSKYGLSGCPVLKWRRSVVRTGSSVQTAFSNKIFISEITIVWYSLPILSPKPLCNVVLCFLWLNNFERGLYLPVSFKAWLLWVM